MKSRIVVSLLSLAALVVVGLGVTPSIAGATSFGGSSVVGGGVVQFGCGPTCNLPSEFGLGVTGHPTPTDPNAAVGTFTFNLEFPGLGHVFATAAATCLDVQASTIPGVGGSFAGVGGHIIATNIPGFDVGGVIHVQAYDGHGTIYPDRLAGDNANPNPENSCVADQTRFNFPTDNHYAVLHGSIRITGG
jgi:hypothetical protein